MIDIRVAGKRALALGGARSQGKGRKVNTGLRGLVCAFGFVWVSPTALELVFLNTQSFDLFGPDPTPMEDL